jgi:transcriptional regulator with XRE-family HTH domain
MKEAMPARIKRIRIARGLSTAKLAELAAVEEAQVLRWEAGEQIEQLQALLRLAEALGRDPHELIFGDR